MSNGDGVSRGDRNRTLVWEHFAALAKSVDRWSQDDWEACSRGARRHPHTRRRGLTCCRQPRTVARSRPKWRWNTLTVASAPVPIAIVPSYVRRWLLSLLGVRTYRCYVRRCS
jgi:hypothetical protein